ncbi:MAG: hypothetical protein HKN21_09750 [Candidatus Eisenbacteria bacterium]|uniref:Adenosine deaminase n=1 Tax=Eiseniibacteriota bacterium TaxID=2212470 RepID=A0A7Y2E9R1_UNCEI|nr:hypothetical protein [Candidatus Eisenbacteria bacterium]
MAHPLHYFFQNLIDYAGLFPPAKLPMAKAVAEYQSLLTREETWMLSHFICPLGRLEDFQEQFRKQVSEEASWTVSFLPRGGEDVNAFLSNLREDVWQFEKVSQSLDRRATLKAIEVKLPAIRNGAALTQLVKDCRIMLSDSAIGDIFLEVGFDEDWEDSLPETVEHLAKAAGENRGPRVGLKIRTGGISADLHPSPDQVAGFLSAAKTHGLAFKATAGLHHPYRHFAPAVQTKQHGFLNLFVGATLFDHGLINQAALASLLDCEDGSRFKIREDGISFGDATASAEQARQTRERFAISYGSCSFDEPIEDLRALDLL